MTTIDILIRVSNEGERDLESESGYTLDHQESNARSAIERRGARVGKIHQHVNQSGDGVLPKISPELFRRLDSGKTHGIAVGYSDRLCRNATHGINFLHEMGERDAILIDATAPDVDYRTDSGRTLWLMRMVMNEMPSLDAKRRSRQLADDLVKNGVPVRAAYGYRRNADALGVKSDESRHAKALVPDDVVDEHGVVVGGTASVVRRIFDLRDDGSGAEEIARVLNTAGIPAPKGGFWTGSTIRALVDNDTYTGVVTIGKGRRNESAHEPLVSATKWRRVQGAPRLVRNGSYIAGLAGGTLVCCGCGQTLSVVGGGGLQPERRNYGCRRLSSAGKCPRPVFVSKVAADGFVDELMRRTLAEGGVAVVASAREIEAARHEWEASVEARRSVARKAAIMEDADFAEMYEEAQAAEREARVRYDEKLADAGDAEDWPTSEVGWDALDLDGRRRIVRQLLDRIVVLPPVSRSKFAPIVERFLVVERRAG